MSGNHQSILKIKSNRTQIQKFFIERELRWRPKSLRVAPWDSTIVISLTHKKKRKKAPARPSTPFIDVCWDISRLAREISSSTRGFPPDHLIFQDIRESKLVTGGAEIIQEHFNEVFLLYNNWQDLWAIGRCRCITTDFVSNWAVPLHHNWFGEQLGGAVASRLNKTDNTKFNISKVNMLEYVWQHYIKFIISRRVQQFNTHWPLDVSRRWKFSKS